jgi:hypothetical protein
MLMLRFPDDGSGIAANSFVVTPIALEAYYEAFAALAKEHPECWHLCQKAEDRCRAEHFSRIVRKLQAKLVRAPTWSEVFIDAAEDDRYWDREVSRPSLGFLARGKRTLTQAEATERDLTARVTEQPNKKGKGNNKKGAKEDKKAANKNTNKDRNSRGSHGDGQAHPKKDHKGRFVTTREGSEICYKYAIGERGACEAPCRAGRSHVCQKCLQPHTNAQCTKSS